ncbi:MAG: hypothetical protein LC131_16755 [Anaerolineae bacterium]|nr:hypothetical protein [Anaerolineae bacterium]
MSDEKEKVDQLKDDERLKIDIPVDDDPKDEAQADRASEIVDEFKKLGRQFADTLGGIFTSEEARRVETEIRAGMRGFADEVEKAFSQAKDSPTASRMKEEMSGVKDRVETGEFARKTQQGMVSGLRWLSTELDKLATQFAHPDDSPAEKPPEE